MIIAVPREREPGEARVALTPEGVKALSKNGIQIQLEAGAGTRAGFPDASYEEVGAKVLPTAGEACKGANLILKVMPPTVDEVAEWPQGAASASLVFPLTNPKLVGILRDTNISAFALELVPRITRAQSMDVLSAMSTIAGYKAVLLAASSLPKFFPMLMTAAGTIPAARVFVIGAGVAGLQAIATSRRLGAVVEAFDVRPAAKEQVESLGARFVALQTNLDDVQDSGGYAKEVSSDTLKHELELIGSRMAKSNVVITTALIPGKPAPTLITREMVKMMAPGSVIIDLAASNGGNCEVTKCGETVVYEGVHVIGPANLVSEMASDASRMFSKNLVEFVKLVAPEGEMKIDLEDQIIRDSLVTHGGAVNHEPSRVLLEKGGQS